MTRPAQHHASVEDAQEAAADWSDQILECRTYGHKWRPATAAYTKDRKAIATTQVCLCMTERHSTLDARTGWVMAIHYEYPDGYVLKGLGRIDGDAKGALRLATVQRVYGVKLRAVPKVS